MAKTIITAALTGAITPRGYEIPETPEAIAETDMLAAKAEEAAEQYGTTYFAAQSMGQN